MSEEVVVAVGLPHVSEIWEEIHRVHHHRKSPLVHSSEYRTPCHTECMKHYRKAIVLGVVSPMKAKGVKGV